MDSITHMCERRLANDLLSRHRQNALQSFAYQVLNMARKNHTSTASNRQEIIVD